MFLQYYLDTEVEVLPSQSRVPVPPPVKSFPITASRLQSMLITKMLNNPLQKPPIAAVAEASDLPQFYKERNAAAEESAFAHIQRLGRPLDQMVRDPIEVPYYEKTKQLYQDATRQYHSSLFSKDIETASAKPKPLKHHAKAASSPITRHAG